MVPSLVSTNILQVKCRLVILMIDGASSAWIDLVKISTFLKGLLKQRSFEAPQTQANLAFERRESEVSN